jgi:hypothetical protein
MIEGKDGLLIKKIKNEMIEYIEKNMQTCSEHEYFIRGMDFLILEIVKLYKLIDKKR